MIHRNTLFRFLWPLCFVFCAVAFISVPDCSRKNYSNEGKSEDSIVALVQTDTVWMKGDPYPMLVYDTVPQPEEVTALEIPKELNQDSVLQAFFKALTYADSIFQDSSFLIRYRLHISRNRLDSLKLFAQNLRPTSVVTRQYAVKQAKEAWYIGGHLGGNAQHFLLAPSLIYQDKKNRLYQLQYDVFGNQLLAGIHFKVR